MVTTRPIVSRVAERARMATVVVASCAALSGCLSGLSSIDDGTYPIENAPLDSAGRLLEVTVPPEATDTRWRVYDARQEYTAVIAFVLPDTRLDTFLAASGADPLAPGPQNDGFTFSDLDLPQPDTLVGTRHTTRPGGTGHAVLTVNVVPHDPHHSRVYLSGW